MSFPLTYKSESNSNMRKYYQLETPHDPSIILETDICLNNLLRHLEDSNITTEDEKYQSTNVVVEPPIVDYTTHLSLEDPNCSITNPTTFCISANFVPLEVSANPDYEQSYTVTVGTNNFNDIVNNITTTIQLATDNSPIFDTNLLIDVTNDNEPCNSVDNNQTVNAIFDSSSPDILLSKAINSGINNVTNNSLLTFGEDTNFNNNYALGNTNALNKYYTENPVTKRLTQNSLINENDKDFNNITVTTFPLNMDMNSFGSYKISVSGASIIEDKNTQSYLAVDDNFSIGDIANENADIKISDLSVLDKYNAIFNDISPDNSFKITINKNENSGLNFENVTDRGLFVIDNSTMTNNIEFIKNIIDPDLPISINLTQQPMFITHNPLTTEGPYFINNGFFNLSSDGEYLDGTKYNIDGEIILEILPKNQRVKNREETPGVFSEINVVYEGMDDDLKTSKDVSYRIKNIIMPTGINQYNAVKSSNYSSLYMSNDDNTDLNVTITEAAIETNNDEIILIKIDPLNVLTNDLNGNKIYVSDGYNASTSQPINANIEVDITGDISILKGKDELRFKIVPKGIHELGFASGVLEYNNLFIHKDDSLSNYGEQLPNSWVLGYKAQAPASGNQYFITTDVTTFSDPKYFPSVNECKNICNNGADIDITFSYESEASSLIYYDVIKILLDNVVYTTIPQTQITKNLLSDVTTYTDETLNGAITIGNKQYKIVKNTRVTRYYSTFSFNLAGTTNLEGRTPVLKSTYITYYIYADTVTIKINNMVTNGIYSSNSYTALQGVNQANTATNIAIISPEPYPTSYIVQLYNDNITEIIVPKLIFNITKSGIYSLKGNIQYKNENSVWTDILDGHVLELEPYLKTNPVIVDANTIDGNPNNNYSITASIYIDKTNNILLIEKPEYFTSLFIEYETTTGVITGYKYNINNLPQDNFKSNFNPNNFIINALPVSDSRLVDLSVNVAYEAETQNSSSYNSVFTIIYNTTTFFKFTLTKSTFTQPIIIAHITKNIFEVRQYIEIPEITQTTVPTVITYKSGNDTNNMIDILNVITINYNNATINQNDYVNFSLTSDKISVQLVKTIEPSVSPSYITSLTYTETNCETLTIDYYRGYKTDNEESTQIYNYIINRNNLVSCDIASGTSGSFTDNLTIYNTFQNIISFNNGIGSIGVKITPSFSRLPKSILAANNKYIREISVTSDSINITRMVNDVEVNDVEIQNPVSLKNYNLYEFPNGQILKSKNLRLNNNGDYYKFTYTKSNTIEVFYNDTYIGNPKDITSWNSIDTITYAAAKDGFILNKNSINTDDGFLQIVLNENSKSNSDTYIVIASPQLVATQMGIDGVKNLLIDSTKSDVYAASELITRYFPIVQDESGSIYTPFVNIDNVNNITFTTLIDKQLTEYMDSSKNVIPVHFDINSSSVIITEIIKDGLNTTTTNGPNSDGIIFKGFISDLINLQVTNPYYSSIKLESILANGQLKLSYTQDSSGYFTTIFSNKNQNIQPDNNMKFIIGNSFIPSGEYELNSSITKGVKINIYDMVKRENDIVLLKYEQSNIDFTNIPKNTPIHQINFLPTKVYTSVVTMPEHIFGTKYNVTFNAITRANINLDASENIIWTQLSEENSAVLINNFSLQIKAVDTTGLNNIIEMLYATSEIPVNFTVFKQSNTMEIFAADGTPRFIITPFGQIQTPSINTKDLTIYDLSSNNNIELLKANVSILNDLF